MTGWAWMAVAVVLIGAGFALLAVARRRAHRPEGDGAGEAIPGLLGPSEAPVAEDLFVPVVEMTPAEEARYWRDHADRPTPGCDCNHDGLGPAWHASDCAWMTSNRLNVESGPTPPGYRPGQQEDQP